MTFVPTQEELTTLRSMAIHHANMTQQLTHRKSGQPLTQEEFQARAYLYAAISFLNKLGALDPEWKKKHGL